jgi:Serine dehydrogenase proteinase
LAGEGDGGEGSAGGGAAGPPGEAVELPPSSRPEGLGKPFRSPLFEAEHSERYARQGLIKAYEEEAGANLVVVIDAIFAENMTYLEELLFDCDSSKPLHMLLASPGGDGETAIRMVRSCQARTVELTIIVPDMAKSAATLMCLGADHLLMGPGGDLGPVDPQFALPQGGLASAKEIVRAVEEAEQRIRESPDTFPLFASLLSDVTMLQVQQARSALDRSGALVREALGCTGRAIEDVDALAGRLHRPLIEEPASHSAVISPQFAKEIGLPVIEADPDSPSWQLVWRLWTRYFHLGCFPVGQVAVYEGRRASHVIDPQRPGR